jgi:hypothetical protein
MMKKIMLGIVMVFFSMSIVIAAADFDVNTFSCTPEEVVINDVFSCTAQIINNGDAAGSVSTATLFSDSNDWLEDSSYAQASGESVDPGQSIEVTFSGLRSVKSGDNGFAKITLDSVTDTYVADNDVDVNVIDVVVTTSDSVSSANDGEEFEVTAEVTAGGNIDVVLTFTVNSGGCGIGNQEAEKTVSGMSDGNKQSKSWTVTMGSTGDCKYTVSAAATGEAGTASTSDTSSSTVTCDDCDSSGSSPGGGSGGGSGGGGGASSNNLIGERVVALGSGGVYSFSFNSESHSLTVDSLGATQATISIESEKQTFTLSIGESVNVDFEKDGVEDISVLLKGINVITNLATIVINPLYVPEVVEGEEGEEESGEESEAVEEEEELTTEEKNARIKVIYLIVGIIVAFIIIVIGFVIKSMKRIN